MSEVSGLSQPEARNEDLFPYDYYPQELVIGPDDLGLGALRLVMLDRYGKGHLSEFDLLSGTKVIRRAAVDTVTARVAQRESGTRNYQTWAVFRSMSADGSDANPAARLSAIADFYTEEGRSGDTLAMLSALAVDPRDTDQGLEAPLLTLAEETVKDLGARSLLYAARPEQIKSFKDLGFYVLGDYEDTDNMTRTMMEKVLEPQERRLRAVR